jgi:hypothetical protein
MFLWWFLVISLWWLIRYYIYTYMENADSYERDCKRDSVVQHDKNGLTLSPPIFPLKSKPEEIGEWRERKHAPSITTTLYPTSLAFWMWNRRSPISSCCWGLSFDSFCEVFSWWGKTCEAVIDTWSSSIGPSGAADWWRNDGGEGISFVSIRFITLI